MEKPDSDTGTTPGTEAPESSDIESLVSQEFEQLEKQDTPPEPEADPAREPDKGKEEKPAPDTPERLYAGKFKTLEEMERATQEAEQKYRDAERKMHEATTAAKKAEEAKKPVEDDFVTLNETELAELKKADPEAYDEYLYESLRRKREAKANAEKANEEKVSKLVDEKLKPFDETRKEIELKKWDEREDKIVDETKAMFGKEFDALDKQRRDVPFIQKVLEQSPLGKLIVHINKEGSPATANQLLLREIQLYNLRQNQEKVRKSVPADAGTVSAPRAAKEKFGRDIEEAFDLSFQELQSK